MENTESLTYDEVLDFLLRKEIDERTPFENEVLRRILDQKEWMEDLDETFSFPYFDKNGNTISTWEWINLEQRKGK